MSRGQGNFEEIVRKVSVILKCSASQVSDTKHNMLIIFLCIE